MAPLIILGGLRPAPAGGLRPGPPAPPSEMALSGQDGSGGGAGNLLAGPRDGCHGTPAQVKGASGGPQAMTLARHPRPGPGGTRRRQSGVWPDEEDAQATGRAAWAGGARHLARAAGQRSWTECSI